METLNKIIAWKGFSFWRTLVLVFATLVAINLVMGLLSPIIPPMVAMVLATILDVLALILLLDKVPTLKAKTIELGKALLFMIALCAIIIGASIVIGISSNDELFVLVNLVAFASNVFIAIGIYSANLGLSFPIPLRFWKKA